MEKHATTFPEHVLFFLKIDPLNEWDAENINMQDQNLSLKLKVWALDMKKGFDSFLRMN